MLFKLTYMCCTFDLFHKLLYESNAQGRAFWNLASWYPFSLSPNGEETGREGIELLQRARLLPSHSCLARLDLGAGGHHPFSRSSRWESRLFFLGHWLALFTPSHLPGFHPCSWLSGGRRGHSNPPTTRADVAGEGSAIALRFPHPALTTFLLNS